MQTTQTITAQVRCINKNPRDDRHRRILNIGGVNPDGGRWRMSEDEAIVGIETGLYAFYTATPYGNTAWVVVAHNGTRKYLKTQADGLEPNNLLALPECP